MIMEIHNYGVLTPLALHILCSYLIGPTAVWLSIVTNINYIFSALPTKYFWTEKMVMCYAQDPITWMRGTSLPVLAVWTVPAWSSLEVITKTSQWAQWRPKSPASPVFAQLLVQAQIKESIKAQRRWPLGEEVTGEFPAQKASNAENVSMRWRHM